jgi:hypothetical protein
VSLTISPASGEDFEAVAGRESFSAHNQRHQKRFALFGSGRASILQCSLLRGRSGIFGNEGGLDLRPFENRSRLRSQKATICLGRLLWEIENHFRTHPPPAERLCALRGRGGYGWGTPDKRETVEASEVSQWKPEDSVWRKGRT